MSWGCSNSNRRVLAQAEDPRNPLLERLKFLCTARVGVVLGAARRLALGGHPCRPDLSGPITRAPIKRARPRPHAAMATTRSTSNAPPPATATTTDDQKPTLSPQRL